MQWPPPGWQDFKLLYIRDKTVESIEASIASCWQESIMPGLYQGAIEAVRRLRDQGVHQVLMTGTPRPLAEPLLEFLGLKNIIAAEPEISNGHYTGRLVSPHPRGIRKVNMADSWLQDNRYSWKQVVAIADHWDDRFLLEKAGVPITVLPDNRLRRHATTRGWAVIQNPHTDAGCERLLDAVRTYGRSNLDPSGRPRSSSS